MSPDCSHVYSAELDLGLRPWMCQPCPSIRRRPDLCVYIPRQPGAHHLTCDMSPCPPSFHVAWDGGAHADHLPLTCPLCHTHTTSLEMIQDTILMGRGGR